jgi:hypothetical protein
MFSFTALAALNWRTKSHNYSTPMCAPGVNARRCKHHAGR